jgi:VWFA-related protein
MGKPLTRTIRLAVSIVAAATLLAQDPGQPTIRVTTRLVQLSVIVHDRKGQPVTDLKKEDFSIFDSGKEQKISTFALDVTDASSQPAPKLAPNIFSNRVQGAGASTSVTAILFDSLNTKVTDQAYARGQLLKFIRQIQPDDHIALYRLGRDGIRILHDFTDDSEHLRTVIEKLKITLPAGRMGAGNDPFTLPDENGLRVPNLDVMETAILDAGEQFRRVLQGMIELGRHLAALPGRKNLVWISGSFPLIPGLGSTISIYPIDARGLMVAPPTPQTAHAGYSPQPAATPPYLEAMQLVAERTGGRAFFNRNDIDNSVRIAIDDAKMTYRIGFYSSSDDWDGKFHALKVKVHRSGLEVRHRAGYFANSLQTVTLRDLDAQIEGQVASSLDSALVGINARTDIVDKPKPGTLLVTLQISPEDLYLQQQGDRWMGNLELVFAQLAPGGRGLVKINQTVALNLTKARYEDTFKHGLIFYKSIEPDEAAESLRVVVQDRSTGNIGSLRVPLKGK